MRKALRVAVVNARPEISHQLAAELYSLHGEGSGAGCASTVRGCQSLGPVGMQRSICMEAKDYSPNLQASCHACRHAQPRPLRLRSVLRRLVGLPPCGHPLGQKGT